MSIAPAAQTVIPSFFLSSAAADNNYQAMNTMNLAPGKVERIKPSNEMQACSEQRSKSFGKGNIVLVTLYLNFQILFTENKRD